MLYETERCSRTFKITYDNKERNRYLRKREVDKAIAEAPFVTFRVATSSQDAR